MNPVEFMKEEILVGAIVKPLRKRYYQSQKLCMKAE